jgi:DNA invertase Pin-like site-specific DNA recombinase
MTAVAPISAAQYLRKSTEHQQYSLENQADAIQRYASQNNMDIVQTYSDNNSGMVLSRRPGLRSLLQDVTKATPGYKVILVYDVSRWGRFLDADESAYYEFLCKLAGIRIHYCAEQFANDGTLVSFLVKSMKRMMAAEYIRELSEKTFEGSKRIAQLGFKNGGLPGFGLRRMLVSRDRQIKTQLVTGERKSIQDDRVILVKGPDDEVRCVREMYQMFLDGKEALEITNDLNRRGIPYPGLKRKQWYREAVVRVLQAPRYNGRIVYGQTSKKLNTPCVAVPSENWVTVPGAWEAIIDAETFEKVQRKLHSKPKFRSDEELLQILRDLKLRDGRLRAAALTASTGLPSIGVYQKRFGCFTNAVELIGGGTWRASRVAVRRRNISLRAQLLDEIVSKSEQKVSIVRRRKFRPHLRLRNGILIAVYICRHFFQGGEPRWRLRRVAKDPGRVTFVARLDSTNQAFQDFYVLTRIPSWPFWTMTPRDEFIANGLRLASLDEFPSAVVKLRSRNAKP